MLWNILDIGLRLSLGVSNSQYLQRSDSEGVPSEGKCRQRSRLDHSVAGRQWWLLQTPSICHGRTLSHHASSPSSLGWGKRALWHRFRHHRSPCEITCDQRHGLDCTTHRMGSRCPHPWRNWRCAEKQMPAYYWQRDRPPILRKKRMERITDMQGRWSIAACHRNIHNKI